MKTSRPLGGSTKGLRSSLFGPEVGLPTAGAMEAVVFIVSLVDCCALIFLAVYFVSFLRFGSESAAWFAETEAFLSALELAMLLPEC